MTTDTKAAMPPTRITAEELNERMSRGEKFTILDNRNPEAWTAADSRIAGDVRVPADEVEQHLDKIPGDRTIITYCT